MAVGKFILALRLDSHVVSQVLFNGHFTKLPLSTFRQWCSSAFQLLLIVALKKRFVALGQINCHLKKFIPALRLDNHVVSHLEDFVSRVALQSSF